MLYRASEGATSGEKKFSGRLEAESTSASFQPEQLSDSSWWLQLLKAHWDDDFTTGQRQLLACKIKRVYYKPENQSYRVYLDVKVGDANGRYLDSQILFAHLFPRHELYQQWTAAQAQTWTQPVFGPPIFLILDYSMIVWAYPNDPRLPGLALLANTEQVLTTLQADPAAFGLPEAQTPIAIKQAVLTKYVASQRCGYFYDVVLSDGSTHPLYAKAYRPSKGKEAAVAWQQVWDSSARRQNQLSLPNPYSYDPTRHILWQEAVTGQPLAKMLPEANLPQLAAGAGHQLAMLHNLKLDIPVGITIEDEKEDLGRNLTSISRALPMLADRCQRIYERLLSSLETLQSAPLVPIHASFKPSHLLVENGRCTLIDFDGTALGDAAYDLGRFIAHLRAAEAKGRLDPETVNRAVTCFITTYNRSADNPVALTRINWFTTSLILSSHINKVVKRMLKQANVGHNGQLDRLLTVAEQLLFAEMNHAA